MSLPAARTTTPIDKYVDLVFEGGGVKGIALVGALAVLEEQGFIPQNMAGTSAGAIVATLYAAGYTAHELRDLLAQQQFARFQDLTGFDRLPMIGLPLSILKDQGLYKGEAFSEWMATLLERKGVHTFGDLVHPAYAHQPRYRYKVQMIASDLTQRRMLVLPQDAPTLGLTNPDELNVALAVRMSMSIPIFFEPVRWSNPQTGQEHLIVDGGLLSNFPIWLFDIEGVPEWPTFGLLLVEPDPKASLAERLPATLAIQRGIEGTVGYLKGLVHTLTEAHDRRYVESEDYVRTIAIPTLGVQTTDFTLLPERMMELYQAGRTAAEQFLQKWNFADYIAAVRLGKLPSRREMLTEQLRKARGPSAAPRQPEPAHP